MLIIHVTKFYVFNFHCVTEQLLKLSNYSVESPVTNLNTLIEHTLNILEVKKSSDITHFGACYVLLERIRVNQ